MEVLARVELLINQQRYDMAIESLNQILAENPNDSNALSFLAFCKLHLKDYVNAIAIGKTALGEDPANDFALYVISFAHFELDNYKKAENAINRALEIDPSEPDYYGLLANIKLVGRDFVEAKAIAQTGLAINPENLVCRNMLSSAQLKLGDKKSAFSTIEKALLIDPENAMTHANYGWGQLEKGSNKKALEHFGQSLAINPMNQNARAGMLEALKARFLLYRVFLKFFFFMSNLKLNVQWALIIGIVVINKMLNSGSESSEFGVYLKPLSYGLTLFVYLTWIIEPLFNFFMSLNSYSRHLLDERERDVSVFVGICLGLTALSLIGWVLSSSEILLASTIVCFTLILPVGRISSAKKKSTRYATVAYSLLLLVIGVFFILASGGESGTDNALFIWYIIPLVGFTWIWNFLNAK
jgi:tetratricopeptide (TPR) repeat protein